MLNQPWSDFRSLLKLGQRVLSLPEVDIRVFGDETARAMYVGFVRPHPRFKLVQHKRWGVALLQLPDTFEVYLKGAQKQALRTNRKRALTSGYSYGRFSPDQHISEIMEINASADRRQGKVMSPSYLVEKSVQEFFSLKGQIHGIFSGQGALRAYAYTPICGEVFVFSRLMGHAQDQHLGVMYLLVSEVIREIIELKNQSNMPMWAMYDTYFGASSGLRYFKDRLGFVPYKVTWHWEEQHEESVG